MTTTGLRHSQHTTPASPPGSATRGPFLRIVVGSLTAGALAAVRLAVGAFPGAVEHVTAGVVLLAFGKPLVVVSASETLRGTAGWPLAQQQLAALSDNSDLRTATSSHGGVLDHPAASTTSLTAIADVVDAVRTGSPLRAS